ncbi:MAG: 30S ribosomal protein S6 [Candidatus Spechtbacterales bacterium]
MEEKQAAQNKRLYELYALLNPQQDDASIERAREELVKILERHNANIERFSPFTKTNLAYPMNKVTTAYGGSISFWMQPDQVESVEEELKVSEGAILRTLLSKNEPKAIKVSTRKPRTLHEKAVKEEATGSAEGILIAVPKEETPATAAAQPETKERSKEKDQDDQKVTLEDIDRKLDEIMGDL